MGSMEWTNRTGHGPEGGVYHWARKEVVVVAADAVAAVEAERMEPAGIAAAEIAAGWTVAAMSTEARPETWDGGSAHP
jgi:hypothetical protein